MEVHLSDLPPPPPGKIGWPWTVETPILSALSYNPPRFSVVTPSYQQGEYLEETIRSVLLQNYPNLEYIVIDGSSSDKSVEVLQKYAKYLTYWVSEKDTGQANAINKGFAHSTGEIMGWLNSDDVLLPGALQRLASTFVHRPSAHIISGFRKVIDSDSNFKVNWVREMPVDFILKRDCCVPQETVYWRRAIWNLIGPLDESLQYALDYEYWLRMLHAGYHFTLIPHFLGLFREHNSSKGATLEHVRQQELEVLYKRYFSETISLAEVQHQLGEDWTIKRALLKDLCHTSFFEFPLAAYLFLSLYTRSWFSTPLTYLYKVIKRRA
jgi:glycosyltransferase involved in cell wall biosynthesis